MLEINIVFSFGKETHCFALKSLKQTVGVFSMLDILRKLLLNLILNTNYEKRPYA